MKALLHEQYKTFRNLFSTLQQSKQIYYTKYFENNWNNIIPLSTKPTKLSNILKQFFEFV